MGDLVELEGNQFNESEVEVKNVKPLIERNQKNLVNLLASGYFKGIGEKKAQKLYDEFGNKLLNIIENDYAQLTRVGGISSEQAKQINEDYKTNEHKSSAIMYFANYGLSTSVIDKIYDKYGFNSESVVTNDPYSLIKKLMTL